MPGRLGIAVELCGLRRRAEVDSTVEYHPGPNDFVDVKQRPPSRSAALRRPATLGVQFVSSSEIATTVAKGATKGPVEIARRGMPRALCSVGDLNTGNPPVETIRSQ